MSKANQLLLIIIAVIIFITTLPLTIFAAGKPEKASLFTDINGNEYYAQAAEVLTQLGILRGYPDGTFGAGKNITRAEIAAVVVRSQGLEEEAIQAKGSTDYKDVLVSHWASGYINKATELNIIIGDGKGSFRPDVNVRYEEAVKIIVGSIGLGDVAIEVGGWPDGYIQVAQENGILNDVPGAKGIVSTRGAVALLTYQAMISQIKKPVASIQGGNYTTAQKILLTTDTKDAKIYYTLDGKDPTTSSTEYTGEFTLSETATLKAITVKYEFLISPTFSADYTIKIPSTRGGSSSGTSSGEDSSTIDYDVICDLS